ncbi:putative short chain dehydrogenase [Xenorhabdus nematophila ATCC 19061]|uniref:Short chain dehydrogenase n=1 Tax=Xenorhabdus nematophila (strain ATCC 19061 / DSM 3370 / CCUG 14189 / LMG 1036 / NCIMB 9965 / AN6) TaxID=406817 RepID=D3VH46_XENNA|nr:SDR family oxidoreductase [Xenorhabdus nematophila]CBJ88331.1 putative short chain dehydrogenase [Xenorhabdus nematophila ATCC 19061]CEK21248.1 putative short chain dehydrogenase [Xenorhabdus nematophila AN6/1]
MSMFNDLKGKRVVVTGGGRDFGQAISVWLAREGAHVDLCARQLASAEATCDIIRSEGGIARSYQCDISDAQSVKVFAEQLQQDNQPVDILILSAAQWLEGYLSDEDSDADIISTMNSGATGSMLLTKALLPSLRESQSADIIAMVSVCGISHFTQSVAHPVFFAVKHAMSGFCQTISHQLSKDNIRVTGIYPPDFEVNGFDEVLDDHKTMGQQLLNGRSIWETIRFVLFQPRSCHISEIYFQGPTREDLE